jgi:hypothetical protein
MKLSVSFLLFFKEKLVEKSLKIDIVLVIVLAGKMALLLPQNKFREAFLAYSNAVAYSN